MADGNNVTALSQKFFPSTSAALVPRIEAILGTPSRTNIQYDAYSRIPRTNLDVHELYKGTNLVAQDTIDNLIIDGLEWYTTVLFPWMYTEEQTIQWSTWDFNHVVADAVPNEGISRLVTSQSGQFFGQVYRKGLAVILEGDFFNTPAGLRSFAKNCKGISQCVLETQSFDSTLELLNCKDNERKWSETMERYPVPYDVIAQEEADTYAIVIKDPVSFRTLFFKHKKILNRRNVQADLLIGAPGTEDYLEMAGGEAQTSYFAAGPDGEIVRRQGPNAIGLFAGMMYFETRDFDVYSNEPKVQPLTRPKSIGEYYLNLMSEFKGMDFRAFETRWRDKGLYNENLDQMVRLPFEEQWANGKIFTKNGELHRHMITLLTQAKAKKQGGKISHHKTDYDSDDDYATKKKDEPYDSVSFPLFTEDEDGKPEWAHFLGQVNFNGTTSQDFENMASSILGNRIGSREDYAALNQLFELIRQIENQPVNKNFLVDLYAANAPNSMTEDTGTFIGERVPLDLVDQWNVPPNFVEFKPNAHGGFDLPRRAGRDYPLYPLMFNTWPGLLTLADEANIPASPFHAAGKMAKEAVVFFRNFCNLIVTKMPRNPLVDPKCRAPWFHRADPCTTLFQLVTNRDPVFWPHLKSKSGGGKGGLASDIDEIPSNVLDLFSIENDEKENPTKTMNSENYVFTDASGTQVLVSRGQLQMDINVLPRGLAVLANLGAGVYQKYVELLNLGGLSPETKKLLTDLVIKYVFDLKKKKEIALIIYNIASLPNDADKKKAVESITSGTPKNIRVNIDAFLKDTTLEAIIINGISVADSRSKDFSALTTSTYATGDSALVDALLNAFNAAKSALAADKVSTIFDYGSIPKYALYEGNANKTLDALGKAADALAKQMANKKINMQSAVGAKLKALGAKVVDFDTSDLAIAGASWYRTPLAMSLSLLESLTSDPVPFIAPSDYRTGHIAPINFNGSTVDPSIWKRPQYATFNQMLSNPEVRDVRLFGAIAKHIIYETKTKPKSSSSYVTSSSSSKKRQIESHPWEDEKSSDSDSDYDTKKKRKTEEKPKVWTKDTLKGKSSKEHLVPFEDPLYSSMYKKVYNNIFAKRFLEANRIGDELLRLTAVCCLFMPNNGPDWDHAIKNNVAVPISLILWRIGITHDMSTYVLLKAGPETGANFYGHSNFSIGSDVQTKMIMANFTFHSKCIVYNPRNIQLMEDMKPERYRGGMNTLYIRGERDFEDRTRDRRSIIVTVVGAAETNFAKVLSFTGKLPTASYNRAIDGPKKQSYSTASYYDGIIFKIGERISERTIAKEVYSSGANRINSIAFPGTMVSFDPTCGKISKWSFGTGHRGKNGSLPGAAAAWDGKTKWLPQNLSVLPEVM
jgi:hypothetical protein